MTLRTYTMKTYKDRPSPSLYHLFLFPLYGKRKHVDKTFLVYGFQTIVDHKSRIIQSVTFGFENEKFQCFKSKIYYTLCSK